MVLVYSHGGHLASAGSACIKTDVCDIHLLLELHPTP